MDEPEDQRAEALDERIERLLAGAGGEDAEDAVLRRVRSLADGPIPADVRTRHLATIHSHPGDAAPAPAPSRPRWLPALQRRLAPLTAAATALVLFAGGGTVALAQDALPDDTLYGVKRASEQVWVSLPRGRERAAQVHLGLAERRIDEAGRVPHHAETLVAAGLRNVEEAADELPEEAVRTLGELVRERHPAHAAPAAKAALHRNCVRIAERHGLSDAPCGDEPHVTHPGRGIGPRQGPTDDRPGWGPGGRPDDHVGPPPWAPAEPDDGA